MTPRVTLFLALTLCTCRQPAPSAPHVHTAAVTPIHPTQVSAPPAAAPASHTPAPWPPPVAPQPQPPCSVLQTAGERVPLALTDQGAAFFVLIAKLGEAAETIWLEQQAHEPNIVGWSAHSVLQWQNVVYQARVRQHEQRGPDCAAVPGPAPHAPQDELQLLALDDESALRIPQRRLWRSDRRSSQLPFRKPLLYGSVASTRYVVGLTGPQLYTRTDDTFTDCAPKATLQSSLQVVPLTQPPLPVAAANEHHKSAASNQASAHYAAVGLDGETGWQLLWEGAVPDYSGGRLALHHLFSKPTLPSHSTWGSELRAFFVPAPAPTELAPWVELPALISRLQCADKRIVGFTLAPNSAAASHNVRAAFGL